MRKLLIRFFQVVCLLQLSAFGQVHAHPDMKSTHSSIITSLNELQPHSFVTSQDKLDEKINLCPAPSGDRMSVGFENIDEKDYELGVSKKSLVSKDYFAPGFHTQLLAARLSHNDKNNLAFSRQSTFVTANRKHLILQVFRI